MQYNRNDIINIVKGCLKQNASNLESKGYCRRYSEPRKGPKAIEGLSMKFHGIRVSTASKVVQEIEDKFNLLGIQCTVTLTSTWNHYGLLIHNKV